MSTIIVKKNEKVETKEEIVTLIKKEMEIHNRTKKIAEELVRRRILISSPDLIFKVTMVNNEHGGEPQLYLPGVDGPLQSRKRY